LSEAGDSPEARIFLRAFALGKQRGNREPETNEM
jgi:hypothetical protein